VQVRSADRIRWTVKTALAATIASAHERGFASLLARDPARPLVLGYHRVVDDFETTARSEMPSMLTSRAMFERHLDCIGRHFEFVSVETIADHMLNGVPFTRPVAAVTFDDGYRDVYEQAFPVLQRKGIPAAVFVVTDLVGQPLWQVHDRLYHLVARAFATWDNPRRQLLGLLRDLDLRVEEMTRTPQTTRTPYDTVSTLLPALAMTDVRRLMDGIDARMESRLHDIPGTLTWAMVADLRRAGWTIGSHTRTHVSLPAEDADTMAEELEGSKAQLEAQLGEPVTHFAYPGGQFNPEVVEAVARAGYQFAYTACTHGEAVHPSLTIERLLLWERSSVDAAGRFSDAILSCQAHDLWPPARKCGRLHEVRPGTARMPARAAKVQAA
jgi:peptidoglycan/xylan/chitin deacetylase (PgdA/CDA1 family)